MWPFVKLLAKRSGCILIGLATGISWVPEHTPEHGIALGGRSCQVGKSLLSKTLSGLSRCAQKQKLHRH